MTSPDVPRGPGESAIPSVAQFIRSIDERYGINQEEIAERTRAAVERRRIEREIAERHHIQAEEAGQQMIGSAIVRAAHSTGIIM